MKQILALILTVLLLCTVLAPSVLAAEEPAVSSETTDTVTDSGSGSVSDDSIDTATPSDADMVTDGNETSGTDDSTARADGFENSVSISVQVIAPVLTVTPAAITLTHFDEPDRTDAVAFPVGTTQEELSNWFADSIAGFIGYDAEGNPYDLISGAWSLDAVDTVTAGVYYAFTSPDLGTEYTLADGVSLPRQLCAVSIQVPGEPDINCCVAGRGFLHFPWVLSAAQEEQLVEFAVWLRQDGGEWTSLNDGFLSVSDGLQLSQRVLTYGSTYVLKVTYPGGQTGVLTFQYDGELSILDYSGGDRDGGDVNGGGSGTGTQPAPTPTQPPTTPTTPQTPVESPDKDNSDSGIITPAPGDASSDSDDTTPDSGSVSEGEPEHPSKPSEPQDGADSSSDVGQPTPTVFPSPSDPQNNKNHNSSSDSQVLIPVAETQTTVIPSTGDESAVPDDGNTPSEKSAAAQESAAVTEAYSPTQTVISGLRLKDLCKEEESVVFGSGDVTVSIPSKLLLALNLSDADTLTVMLTQPESNQIVLAVEVSGKSVTELTGAVLRLRYIPQSKNTEITVQNEVGERITDVSYDGELLRFAADTAGTYTITELSTAQETGKSTSPLLPVSGGLLLAAGGITLFRRKRHG